MRNLIRFLSSFCVTLIISILFFIILFIFLNGFNIISFEFLFSSPKGIPFGANGGILPAIVGSLLTTIMSTLTASIFAICTAILSVFYIKNNKLSNIISILIQSLSGIPSILIGLFGYSLFVITLDFGKSVLSSTLALAIMIFPYIEVNIEKLLREFNKDLILSSFSLGISKEYTIVKLALKLNIRKILSHIAIASSFAMGATAPIMLTGAVINAPIPESLTDPFMALPYHLYILLQNGINKTQAFGTALVLILIIFIINFLGLYLGGKNE